MWNEIVLSVSELEKPSNILRFSPLGWEGLSTSNDPRTPLQSKSVSLRSLTTAIWGRTRVHHHEVHVTTEMKLTYSLGERI